MGTAPFPVDTAGRLEPFFVAWMMGRTPDVIDGLSRTQALKALGNSVIPLQAYVALSDLDAQLRNSGPALTEEEA